MNRDSKDTFLKEIGLRVQKLITIIVLVNNIVGGLIDYLVRNRLFTLTMNKTFM